MLLAMLAVVAEASVAVTVIVVLGGRWSTGLAGWPDVVSSCSPTVEQLEAMIALPRS